MKAIKTDKQFIQLYRLLKEEKYFTENIPSDTIVNNNSKIFELEIYFRLTNKVKILCLDRLMFYKYELICI